MEATTMTIGQHAELFAGFRVQDYDPENGVPAGQADQWIVNRLTISYEAAESGVTFPALLHQFLSEPGAAEAPGLVIGAWGGDAMNDPQGAVEVVQALVTARDRLPSLRALFVGDIVVEECEISWINQTDMGPLLRAYRSLEHFRVRGGTGLHFSALRHDELKSLVVETGGLGADTIAEVVAAELPRLEHLELWLGSTNYGGIDDVAPLMPLLGGNNFPRLRTLALRDSEIADAVAGVVAVSPLLQRLRVLDLSLGNLSNAGANALIASPAVRALEKLDIHYHYVSPAVVAQLERLGIEIDASEARETDEDQDGDDRYIAVSE
jgi:hypothetical protein